MTRRREDFPLRKVALNLFDGEFDELRRFYPASGAGKIVRTLVHQHLKRIKRKLEEHRVPNLEADLKEIQELLS